MDELRTQFSTALERAREQVVIAQDRAEASERRALRELDQEHTARQKSERAAEDLRMELAGCATKPATFIDARWPGQEGSAL